MSSQSFSFRASPSVSKERWLKHAVHKMSRGYNLIVNKERKVANFYKGFGAFESCSYQTARKLVVMDFIELVGEHEMGLEYRLKSDNDLEVSAVSIEEEDDDEVSTEADSVLDEGNDAIDDELEGAADEEDEEEHKYDDDTGFNHEEE